MSLKSEIVRAMKETCVLGVPMLLKAESTHSKVLWAFAVVMFLTTGFYQSYQLTVEFLAHPKITLINEIPSKHASFPIVQVCNIDYAGIMRNMALNETFEHYKNMVRTKLECKNCSSEENRNLQDLKQNLMSQSAFLVNIGPNNILKLLPDYTDFLIECTAFSPAQYLGTNCETFGHIDVVPSCNNFLCLRLKIPENTTIEEISMTFYISSIAGDHNAYNTKLRSLKLSTGVVFSLLNDDFTFGSSSAEFSAQPGMMTTVLVHRKHITRLSAPFGDCVKHKSKYTPKDCDMQCWIDYSVKYCNCSSSCDWRMRKSKDLMPCSYVGLPLSKLIENALCHNKLPSLAARNCNCPQPCSEVQYKFEVSLTKWPAIQHYPSFYNKLIKHRYFANIFSSMSDTNKTTSFEMVQLVENNFVRIVFKPQFQVTLEQQEVPKYSPFSFIGTLGGSLNLWTGITVVVFVEIFQLFIGLLQICASKKMKMTN